VCTFVLACKSLTLTAAFASLWLARLVKGDRRLYNCGFESITNRKMLMTLVIERWND
jgi:hypothetical protein